MDRPRQDSEASVASIRDKSRRDSAISISSVRERSSIDSTNSLSLPSINEGFPRFQETGPRGSPFRTHRLLAPHANSAAQIVRNNETVVKLDGRPLKTYSIDGNNYTMMESPNENEVMYTRRTKDGRRLRFHLEVLQQPMRARACGSGPRCITCLPRSSPLLSTNTLTASADRRPVDPPPVVRLKVLSGEDGAVKDVTMDFESQLIIFTTLEVARPIANGRMYAQNHRPVLTGTCAAGTSHLEKPHPAAYFIFPDLSVRHEGWYNLRFSLFEKITNEADRGIDENLETCQQQEDKHSPSVWDGLVNRMEVRTSKFQVYSAKKFPGLKGSTDLSRLIADQGCRVEFDARYARGRDLPKREPKKTKTDNLSSRLQLRQTPLVR